MMLDDPKRMMRGWPRLATLRVPIFLLLRRRDL